MPHVTQLLNWDCGLACVLMVLRKAGIKYASFETLRMLCPTTSVWTVDLAHLLHHYGMQVHFYTTTIGANPEYRSESFYVESMEEDCLRVDRLFSHARLVGIDLQQRQV